MGATTFPAPSAAENWVTIGSVTPTSGNAVNFTGITGYKKLFLVADRITLSAADKLILTLPDSLGFVGLQSALTSPMGDSWSGTNPHPAAAATSFHHISVIFPTPNQAIKQACEELVMGNSTSGSGVYIKRALLGGAPAAITQVGLGIANSATFVGNTGTVYLFGVAA